VVRFPNTAILYLDSTDSTPDTIKIRIQTNSGEIIHEVPTIKVKKYSLEELFEKNLLFLLPFYIFNYSKYRVGQMEEAKTAKQKEELEQLLSDFKYLVQRIEEYYNAGKIEEYVKLSLINLSNKVLEAYLKNYKNVKGKVDEVMGGKIIQYEAKTIFEDGLSQGRNEERTSGIGILIQTYKKFGQGIKDAIQAVSDEYHMSIDEAEAIVKKNW
jgi:hypothetical protein